MRGAALVVEGVPYQRYLVSYVTSDGKRRRKVLYAPGRPWIGDTVHHWIANEDVNILAGSNVCIRVHP